MDRLIIETILADVDEISFSTEASDPAHNNSILLSYRAGNMDQINHAFLTLKKLMADHKCSLVICKTMTTGLFDLEIVCDALDEPIRINNKVIEHEVLNQIESYLSGNPEVNIALKESPEEHRIHLHEAEVRIC